MMTDATPDRPIEPYPFFGPRQRTLVELLDAADARKAQGPWIPACGGTEVPFTTRTGARLLYCWQPSTGKHAYLDCGTDIILTDAEAANLMGMS
jgi:hypothetical protein